MLFYQRSLKALGTIVSNVLVFQPYQSACRPKFYSFRIMGVQPFGISGPHWKKSCLGPHIKYTNTTKN